MSDEAPLEALRRSAARIIAQTCSVKARHNASLEDGSQDLAALLVERLFVLGWPHVESTIALGLTCKRIHALVRSHVRQELCKFEAIASAMVGSAPVNLAEKHLVAQTHVHLNHLLGPHIAGYLRRRYPGVVMTMEQPTLCSLMRRTCQLCAATNRPCFGFVAVEDARTAKAVDWTFFVAHDVPGHGARRLNLFCRNTCFERACIRLCPRGTQAREVIKETRVHRANPIVERVQNCIVRERNGQVARSSPQLFPIMLAREALVERQNVTLVTSFVGSRERQCLALRRINLPGNHFFNFNSMQQQLGISDAEMTQLDARAARLHRRMQRAEDALLGVHMDDAIDDVLDVWTRAIGDATSDASVISCEAMLAKAVQQMLCTHAELFSTHGSSVGCYPTLQGIVALKNGIDEHTHMPLRRLLHNLRIYERVTDPHALLWASGALFASMPCHVGFFKTQRLVAPQQHRAYCLETALHVAATLSHDDVSVWVGTNGECRPYDLADLSMQMETLLIQLRRGPLTITCSLELDAYENVQAVHAECARALQTRRVGHVPSLPSRWSWTNALRPDWMRVLRLVKQGFSCGESVDRWAAVAARRVALGRVCAYMRAMVDELFTLGSAGRVLVLLLLRLDASRIAEAVRRHHLTFLQGDVRRLLRLMPHEESQFRDSLMMEM